MGAKVLHLADIHLGMENYGRLDSKTGLNARLLDFLASFDQAVEYALEHRMDLVVFAGDAYKTRDPNPTQQREFAARLKRLSAAGIPTVLVVGNHDVPNSDGKAHSLEIFRTLGVEQVFVSRRPEVLTIPTRSGPVQVACLPYLTRSSLLAREEFKGLNLEELERKMAELLTMFISKLASDLDPRLPSILAAHISVANAVLGSETSIMVGRDVVLPLSAVALPQFDYVALGHIHRHQVLQAADPPVVYAGSIDRVDFGEEKEEKGFCVVNLTKRQTGFKFFPVNNRPFLSIEISPRQEDPTDEILSGLSMYDLEQVVVRLKLNLSQAQTAVVRLDEVYKYLQREAYFVAGVSRQVSGAPVGVRSPGLTERVKPLEALEIYLQLQPELAEHATQLLEMARGLASELEGEGET